MVKRNERGGVYYSGGVLIYYHVTSNFKGTDPEEFSLRCLPACTVDIFCAWLLGDGLEDLSGWDYSSSAC